MLQIPDPDLAVVHVHTRAHGGLGAMSRRSLDKRVHSGEVAPDDVFWFQGMSEWREVHHHPELFDDLTPVEEPSRVQADSPGLRPDDSTLRPIETLEPQLIDAPAQTVQSVGHPAPFQLPSGIISLAEDPVLDLGTEQRTWLPDPFEDDETAPHDTPDPHDETPPHNETDPHAWPKLHSRSADALVPTDTALGDQPTDDGIEAEEGTAATLPTVPADPRLDTIFTDLLEGSWDYQEAHEFAGCVDEVFLGAVITSALDVGRVLIDLSSDGTHHFLRFEHPDDSSRVLFRLTHLTGNLTTSRVQGHMASMVIGYGERVTGFGEVWTRLSGEPRSGLVSRDQPGTLVTDGDMASQYVYVQVRLYLRIDDYVSPDWSIDHDRLRDHLTACVRALRVHLYGRLR